MLHQGWEPSAKCRSDGKTPIAGKVTDLKRATTEGFARGTATISGLGCSQGKHLTIDFQNENLIAREADTVIATTPDLICCLDTQSKYC